MPEFRRLRLVLQIREDPHRMQSAELPEQLTESYRKTERELSERLKRSDRKTIGFIAATKLELIQQK